VTASGRCVQIAGGMGHNVVSLTGRRESTRPNYCMSNFPYALLEDFLVGNFQEWKCCRTVRLAQRFAIFSRTTLFLSNRRLIVYGRLQNVGGLEERLSGIEKTLASISHTIVEIHEHLLLTGLTSQSMAEPMDPNQSRDLGQEYLLSSGFLERPNSDLTDLKKPRYVARDLPGLCEELRDSITLFSGGISCTSQDSLPRDSVTELLDELCHVGSTEHPICIESDNSPVELPPRELLAMACTSFFQPEDAPIDIFHQSVFWTNVDRIYSSTFSSHDTAWAVSFCLIILLGLCSSQGEHGQRTDFSKPYRSTVIRSLGSAVIFLTPKLINLQTLALLVSFLSKTLKSWMLSK